MDLAMSESAGLHYKTAPQKIRVISERWFAENMYCPSCGMPNIQELRNNAPVADFVCEGCKQTYELKSSKRSMTTKIPDGAYSTMIHRISSDSNPDLFLMQYSEDYHVDNLTLIPRFFFVPSVIEKRNPLSENARRAGWVGCNILIGTIPNHAKIPVIKNRRPIEENTVVSSYNRVKLLMTDNMEKRSWLIDVLKCIEQIDKNEFTLQDVYEFTEQLQEQHAENKNVKAKIRQQLQFIRDKGFIEFLGRGRYRKSADI